MATQSGDDSLQDRLIVIWSIVTIKILFIAALKKVLWRETKGINLQKTSMLTMYNSLLTSTLPASALRHQQFNTHSGTQLHISDCWTKYVDSDNWSTELPAAFSFECSSRRCQPSECFQPGNLPLRLLNHAMHCSPLNLSKALWILSIRRAAKCSQNTPVFSYQWICQSNLFIIPIY